MNGRVYAVNRSKGIVAIETELHGFTIVEIQEPADVEMGDEIGWDSDLEMGAHRYNNLSTSRCIEVIVISHFVSRSSVRQHMAM
ncbi:MAG: hypothetical protein WC809_03050 [Sinimarinibacterium sp.]|jgi:hypothetical protein